MRVSPKLRAGLLIAGLAATFGAMIWVERGGDTQGADEGVVAVAERRAPARASGAAPAAGSAPAAVNAAGLDLTRLQRAQSMQPARDPFGSRSFKPGPAERRELPPSAPVEVVATPATPVAPPVPYTFLGRLSEEDSTTVFLAAGDRNLVVKPGDVIDNNYRVDAVTDNAVSLTYLPLNIKQTLSTGAQ